MELIFRKNLMFSCIRVHRMNEASSTASTNRAGNRMMYVDLLHRMAKKCEHATSSHHHRLPKAIPIRWREVLKTADKALKGCRKFCCYLADLELLLSSRIDQAV